MSSTRDRVLAAIHAFRPRAVEVKELGGTIYLRPLTVAGFARLHRSRSHHADAIAVAKKALEASPASDALKAKLAEAEEKSQQSDDRDSIRMLSDAIVDESGRQIFEGATGEAILASLPAQVAGKILDHIAEVVTMTATGEDGASGNLPATP